MSIDLTRALHDTVDDGAGGHADETGIGIDLATLTTRVRRRRTRRAVVRGAVGAGAAGAFAFAGVQVVGRRGPDDVLPAANPSAAPGTCGSDIGDLVANGDRTLTLSFAGAGETPSSSSSTSTTRDPDEDVHHLDGRLLTFGLVSDGPVTVLPGTAADGTEAGFEYVVPAMDDTSLLVVHGSTVVAVADLSTGSDALVWASTVTDEGRYVGQSVATARFVTCSTMGQPGGDPLPDGTYQAYVLESYSQNDAEMRTLGGPSTIELGPAPALLTGLPAGFPSDEVPVVGNRVVDAHRLEGTTAGWQVEVAVDNIGAIDAAIAAIGPGGTRTGNPTGASELDVATVLTDRWTVTIGLRPTEDGTQVLRYRLLPR